METDLEKIAKEILTNEGFTGPSVDKPKIFTGRDVLLVCCGSLTMRLYDDLEKGLKEASEFEYFGSAVERYLNFGTYKRFVFLQTVK